MISQIQTQQKEDSKLQFIPIIQDSKGDQTTLYTNETYRDGISNCVNCNISGYKVKLVNPGCIEPEEKLKQTGKPSQKIFHIEDLFLNLKTGKLEDPTSLGLSVLDLCLVTDDIYDQFVEDPIKIIETIHLAN